MLEPRPLTCLVFPLISSMFTGDLLHRILQIILGSLVAFSAVSIAHLDIMENTVDHNNTLQLSVGLLLFQVFSQLPYWELWCGKNRVPNNARQGSIRQIVVGCSSLFCFLASFINTLFHGSFVLTCVFWALAAMIPRALYFIRGTCKLQTRHNSVPIHVEFTIHRYGEFTMLFLGESIISIIVVDVQSSADFISTYFLCYFLVATLALLVFESIPFHPDQHAIRRSALRFLVYLSIHSMQCIGLITIGTGFKLILTATPKVKIEYVWLLAGSLAVVCTSVFVGRILHHGLDEELFVHKREGNHYFFRKKIVLWILKVLGTASFLFAPLIRLNHNESESWGVILFCWLLCSFLYLIQYKDAYLFQEHHLMKIHEEVEKRMAKYEKEGFDVSVRRKQHAEEHLKRLEKA